MRVAWLFLASSTLLMAGCSVSKIATDEPVASPTAPAAANVAPVKGTVHGGQQPIWNAHIYMFAVSTTGYGTLTAPQPSQSLLIPGHDTTKDSSGNYYVTTSSNGNFTITQADYSCGGVIGNPVTQQVYLYSIGGQPGTSAGTNSGAGLMAVLGPCTISAFTGLPASVQMNEATTVAAAYALSGFAVDATHMSGSNTALAAQGMANAAATAGNLVNLGTGLPLQTTLGTNGVVPQIEINTLADILAACVNSTAVGTDSSTACTQLFADATADGTPATPPGDTATAAINIAHHPGANAAALAAIPTSQAPFMPNFTTTGDFVPNDWTIAIVYTGGGIDEPTFLAIDGSSNVWTSNLGSATISEFSNLGTPFTGSPYSGGGLADPQGIAVDTVGNVWVANLDGGAGGIGSVSEYSSGTWTTYTDSGLGTDPGLGAPTYIAIDGNNNAWVANNSNNTVSAFNASFSETQAVYWTAENAGGLSGPLGIAVDSSSDAWVANYANDSGTSVSEFTVTMSGLTPDSPITGGDLGGPQSLAVDHAGNIWVTNLGNYDGTSITEIPILGGVAQTPVNITGGGLNAPFAVAIDGLGNAWVTNDGNNTSLSEFSIVGGTPTAVSPSTGLIGTTAASPFGPVLTNPVDLAIDGSGNVWVVDVQYSTTMPPATYPDNLVEFVGAAAPVVTPLAVGVKNGTLGTTP